MAAMLSSELSSSDTIAKYIGECRNMGIAMLPPDINESSYEFAVDGNNIRFGLGGIKGVGEGAIESVLEARRRVGRFRSLSHLATEVDLRLVNRKVFECLVKTGAFDSLGIHRTALWHSLDALLDYAQRRRQEREVGQSNLFGAVIPAPEPQPDPSIRPWAEKERLRFEKEGLGLYLTGNPLSEHQEALSRLVSHTSASLKEILKEGSVEGSVTLGGIVNGFNRVKIKSGMNAGKFMGRFVLEDLEGSLPVTLFANQLQQFGHLLADDAVVLVKGQVRERGTEVEITVEEVQPLSKLATRPLAGVDLTLGPKVSQREMLRLRDLLIEHPGDVPVTLEVKLPDRTVRIAAQESFKVRFGPELAASIEGLLGHGSVRER
jgi:DNA polymerase-3 subunit alpha